MHMSSDSLILWFCRVVDENLVLEFSLPLPTTDLTVIQLIFLLFFWITDENPGGCLSEPYLLILTFCVYCPSLEDIEKEDMNPPVEAEFLLQWGSRKRLRCVRVSGNNSAEASSPSNTSSSSRIRRRINSTFLTLSQKEAPFSQPTSRHTRYSWVEKQSSMIVLICCFKSSFSLKKKKIVKHKTIKLGKT